MRISDFARRALGIGGVVVLLSGCAVSQTSIGTPGAMPQTSSVTAGLARPRSWMSPGTSRGDLLYAINDRGTVVYVITYPGGKPAGTLTGLDDTAGICSDANGNVWIVNTGYSGKIVEYAHGGNSPIKTLSKRNFSPQACSVDSATGNLAVIGSDKSVAAIALFVGAKQSQLLYAVPFASVSFCGYDNSGNLFVDGFLHSNSIYMALGELRKGAARFKEIAFPSKLVDAGEIQWDGKHIVIGSGYAESKGTLFRYDIRGDTAVKTRSVALNGLDGLQAFWIQGSRVVATDLGGQGSYPSNGFYNYPAGGNPIKTLEYFPATAALTVSRAPK
jgi:hypothetical protein